MKTFNQISFNGVFRDYQQTVLDNSRKHLKDRRIHIVAAPGSGKTILGLELVRRQGKPALILSPSVTIRQQWGERFEGNFIPKGKSAEGYVSFDLKSPELLTSVTYQALHAAFNKTMLTVESDSEELETESSENFTDFDLMATIKAAGIKTICLDEAHHLRREWQKALEGFLSQLGKDTVIISLTATPPYDSTPGEWNSYSTLCGEIDEEIFVPQLVAQKTLCPHQDYIYFSYPTENETEILKAHKARALSVSEDIICGGLLEAALNQSGLLDMGSKFPEIILANIEQVSALFCAANHGKITVPDKLMKIACPSGRKPQYRLELAEISFQFIIDNPEIFTEDISEKFRIELSQNALIEKKKVCLISSDKINKMLISSTGKLNSIKSIVSTEYSQLGSGLRMLILTDYIKKDMKKIIGSDEAIGSMGTVPVFEAIRRAADSNISTAVLSGGLVIIPNSIVGTVQQLAAERQVACSIRPMMGTEHSEAVFSGSNKSKVAIITEAFQNGLINVLIGTKSLLGEGWDAPCINSIILASFVGSFMLSNQMRGRAIRIDRNNPEKASNIWHLVTIEPPMVYKSETEQLLFQKYLEDESRIVSNDFDTVERRFNCFLAPAYNSNVIESGIERIDILKPPYNEAGIGEIDRRMLELASDRQAMAKRWDETLKKSDKYEILEVNEMPLSIMPAGLKRKNISALILRTVLLAILIFGRVSLSSSGNTFLSFVCLLLCIAAAVWAIVGFFKLRVSSSPEKFIASMADGILKTLKSIGEAEGDSHAEVKLDPTGTKLYCMLNGATVHEKNVFAKAIEEFFSVIDNPRYIIVKSKKIFSIPITDHTLSYACPSAMGNKKENAELLARNLKKTVGRLEAFYTRNDAGRDELLKCRGSSYININECRSTKKKVLKTR